MGGDRVPGKRVARVDQDMCVCCGACARVCPREAIEMVRGLYAGILSEKCVGCALCAKACPASVIEMEEAR